MRTGTAVSAALHATLLALMLFGDRLFPASSSARVLEIPQVDLISGVDFDAALSDAPNLPDSGLVAPTAPTVAPETTPPPAATESTTPPAPVPTQRPNAPPRPETQVTTETAPDTQASAAPAPAPPAPVQPPRPAPTASPTAPVTPAQPPRTAPPVREAPPPPQPAAPDRSTQAPPPTPEPEPERQVTPPREPEPEPPRQTATETPPRPEPRAPTPPAPPARPRDVAERPRPAPETPPAQTPPAQTPPAQTPPRTAQQPATPPRQTTPANPVDALVEQAQRGQTQGGSPRSTQQTAPTQSEPRGDRPLSQGAKNGLVAGIKRHFVPPEGIAGAANLSVTFEVTLSREGKIIDRPRRVAPGGALDSAHRTLELRALRALAQANEAGVFATLPPESYDTWRAMRVTFTPEDLLL